MSPFYGFNLKPELPMLENVHGTTYLSGGDTISPAVCLGQFFILMRY